MTKLCGSIGASGIRCYYKGTNSTINRHSKLHQENKEKQGNIKCSTCQNAWMPKGTLKQHQTACQEHYKSLGFSIASNGIAIPPKEGALQNQNPAPSIVEEPTQIPEASHQNMADNGNYLDKFDTSHLEKLLADKGINWENLRSKMN